MVRSLNLSMTSVQMNEARSKDWVIGLGYRLNDFNLFGLGVRRKTKGHKKNANADMQQPTTEKTHGGVNHNLNLNLDFSYRKQASLTRDIATVTSNASSGNSAFRLNFYYDFQSNTPLLSSNSYPTSTRDFGLSVKFSLTR